jgi:prolyl oligopeptidase
MHIIERNSRLLVALCVLALLGAGALQYPPFPVGTTVDTYYGWSVSDPYRQLENPTDPAVVAWAAAETKLATDFIRSQPSWQFYAKRISELNGAFGWAGDLKIAGGRIFYLSSTPGEQQPKLVVRDSVDASERVLFDPTTSERNGVQPSISEFYVAPDGSKVAISTQYGGDEDETLHVIDATSGSSGDVIPHVGGGTSPTAVAWDADGRGFVHTVWPRNPDGSYATNRIYLVHHSLRSDPSTDTYVFGKGLSPKAEYLLVSSPGSKALAIFQHSGDGTFDSVYLRWNGRAIVRVATPDAIIGGADDPGGFVGNDLYVISKKRSSFGEVLAIAPNQTIATAKQIVPPSNVVITGIVAAKGGFITEDVDGGDSAARHFNANGTLRARLPIPPISVGGVIANPLGGPILISYQNYTTPKKYLVYDPQTNTATPAPIVGETAIGDFSQIVAERVTVPSLDGKVKIPVEIVHAKNLTLDDANPTILYAYGAYGIMTTPYYDPTMLAWLERGGVFAQAMIRGGGEYGEAWHVAARLATKTVSSDDLAACARWLGTHGYAGRAHLGIWGGSAGGFLMGLALTRDPELYRAVVSEVGIYDLLRWELTPNGAFNTAEFGTVKDPAEFSWMYAQSPYHHVAPGGAYPAVLMTTGENDPRVDPSNSRKMVARLQADSSSGNPVLLIQRSGQGHGIGNSLDQESEQTATVYTFFDGELR